MTRPKERAWRAARVWALESALRWESSASQWVRAKALESVQRSVSQRR
ncbi:MAG: hypothetical protein V3S18_05115 [Dehalococcoidia bacterium]